MWTKADLITQLARENVGRLSATQIFAEADAFLARNDLIRIQPERNPDGDDENEHRPARRYTEDRYAARWWVEGVERDLLNGAVAHQNDHSVAADPCCVATQRATTDVRSGPCGVPRNTVSARFDTSFDTSRHQLRSPSSALFSALGQLLTSVSKKAWSG